MAYQCVRAIVGLQVCGCDACRVEKGWTPNDPPTQQAAPATPSGTGCGRGCADSDDCRGSLISPCPQGRYQGEETWLSANDGCGGCGGLDGECYCGEE